MRSKERIQEMFGQAVVSAFREFASRDLKSAIDYSTQTFGHIANPEVRDCFAEVFYGCRWFLKVALALQADNNERKSIARFQIIDYGSIAECLLLECCRHALNRKLFKYNYHEHQDPPDCKKPLNWTSKPVGEGSRTKRSFAWLIEVSHKEGIIDFPLSQRLRTLRNLRNTVHIAERAKLPNKSKSYQLRIAKKAYRAVNETIKQTRIWMHANL